MSTSALRFKSALRKLSQQGANALQPQKTETTWRAPAISKRVARELRKQAIRDGTYGSFDSNQLRGWNPQWDTALLNPLSSGRIRLRPSKKPSRHRTREQRAQKIENNLIGMDERIQEHLQAKADQKPPKTFNTIYKKLMSGAKDSK